MPVVDGSTSTYPYTRAVYGALFWNYDNSIRSSRKSHSKSHESYERLSSTGRMDALFAATLPSEELKAQAEAAGVELEYIPIAYERHGVLHQRGELCHRADPKANTGHICVREIYELEIRLGGPDAELSALTARNTDSGSHALMEQYFLEGGKHLPHAPTCTMSSPPTPCPPPSPMWPGP